MMNKKLLALFVAIATVSAISADCYRDERGYRHCEGVVGGAVQGSENVAKRTGLFVGDVLSGGRASENYEDRQERKRDERERREENYRARYYD